MVSQVVRGNNNVVIAVEASQNVTIRVGGSECLKLTYPPFPEPLPAENTREIELLKARFGVTPFEGRTGLFNNFIAWADAPQGISARTLVGAGGAGKTRFALELYLQVRARPGWNAAFLRFSGDNAKGADLWQETSGDNLLIVDYASEDAKPLANLLKFLREPPPDQRRLRLLLLARTASWDDGWLASLRSGRSGGNVERFFHPREPIVLPDLSSQDRRAVFIQTGARMAELTKQPAPPEPPPEVFANSDVMEGMNDPLTLMMSAAAHLRGHNAPLDLSRTELAFDTAAELVAGRMPESIETHQRLFLHMAAYATLCGGFSRAEALKILKEEGAATGLNHVPDPDAFLNTLHEWLPGNEDNDGKWIGTIQPDIVGEAFVLGPGTRRYLVDPEAAIERAMKRNPGAPMSLIIRTAQDFSAPGPRPRKEPLNWVSTLVRVGEEQPGFDFLLHLMAQMPTSTVSLSGVALEVAQKLTERLIEHSEQHNGVRADLAANILDTLAQRQSDAGLIDEALQTAGRAVDLYRQLVEAHGESQVRGLGRALNILANRQAGTAQYDAALVTATEAESIFHKMVIPGDPESLGAWESVLSNLANRQSQAGKWEEALASGEQVVALVRDLAAADRAQYLPRLAGALTNYSGYLADAKKINSALLAAQEAVDLFAEVIRSRRDSFLPDYANALNNLANQQSELGRVKEALASATASLNVTRELVRHNRRVFLPDLAGGLHNLSLRQGQTGLDAEALASGEEAVTIWRELVAQNRPAYLHGLAGSLQSISLQQNQLGLPSVAAARESIVLWREAVAANRPAFLPDLARALNDYATRSSETTLDEALPAAAEAMTLFAELTRANPVGYAQDYARALNNLGDRYNQNGEFEKAALTAQEAADIYRQFIDQLQWTWIEPAYARAAETLGSALLSQGRFSEAADAFHQALDAIGNWTKDNDTYTDFVAGLRHAYLKAIRLAGREVDPKLLLP